MSGHTSRTSTRRESKHAGPPLSKSVAATLKNSTARRLRREIFAQTRSAGFKKYLRDLVCELCRIDTTPNPDVSKMRAAEEQCFRILERELGSFQFVGGRIERKAINPAIRSHTNFSLLHFTKTANRPEGLPLEEVYRGRANLVFVLPGTNAFKSGCSIALNAHLDVVAPYFPPAVQGGTVFGRGTCDDKGPVVGIVAALKILSAALSKTGVRLNRNVLAMFVVEEETGGNGTLSLAIDRDLRGLYDSVLVSECTGLKVHPANRGAVWYRAEFTPEGKTSAFEMSAFIIEELEKEGEAIRAESRHDLFPQRPVQTCHGIIGPYGEHPSRICGKVTFSIGFPKPAGKPTAALVKDCLNAGLAAYVGLYGDKTKALDPATGKPMVAHHYKVRRSGKRFVIDVFGATGHMGSIRERDGAITKTAFLVRSLLYSKAKIEKAPGQMTLALGEEPNANAPSLVLEGGQGFVPTHSIAEVMARLEHAAQRGAETYLRRTGHSGTAARMVKVTYEKLHNVAFDGDPHSPSMNRALQAGRICGLPPNGPVLGWTVSCDARLFATEYPGMPVLTFGPGQLVHAHSDREQIDIEEIRSAAEFLAVFLLLQTGTLAKL